MGDAIPLQRSSKICFWIIAGELFCGFSDLTNILEKVFVQERVAVAACCTIFFFRIFCLQIFFFRIFFDRERELLLHLVALNSPGLSQRATLGMVVVSKSNQKTFLRKQMFLVIVKLVNEYPSQEHIFQIFFCEKVQLDKSQVAFLQGFLQQLIRPGV